MATTKRGTRFLRAHESWQRGLLSCQPTLMSPTPDYPAVIRAAGPDAMHAYDALIQRLTAANGAAGPATLYPEEVELLVHQAGGPIPPDLLQHPIPPDTE
jgi:hypothetical protein